MLEFICPHCAKPLTSRPSELSCSECSRQFPVIDGIVDFLGGVYYDAFSDPSELTSDACSGLENEVVGAKARIEDFYLPLIAKTVTTEKIRVLDSGCGNGISVDLLNSAGHTAWGNDASALRKWQWRERVHRDRLVVADTRKLPFPDGFFDVVISSGVLEHIGVDERGGEAYWVKPRADRDAARQQFLAELFRVLKPMGHLYLDFPNGAFPIDFWHGPKPGGARFHPPWEGFLPTVSEVRRYLHQLGDYNVKALSAYRRLRMRQVGQHWYGRLLRKPMELFLLMSSFKALGFLASSPFNPYLVLDLYRSPKKRLPAVET